MKFKKLIALVTSVACAVALTACGGGSDNSGSTASSEPAAAVPVGEQVDYTIYGIDPGAGITTMAHNAIDDYGLDKWTLSESSDAAMMAELDKKYKKEEPIIITGWTPHWMFQAYDLKYLDDPKLSFGEDERIDTVVRLGLEADEPSAYAFLKNFKWKAENMEAVMNDARETSPEEAAQKWVSENSDLVDEWVEGIEPVDGNPLKIAYVAWDSEIATSHVVQVVLKERLGYDAELTQLDNGTMWASVAKGDSDAMVSAWLPTTHGEQYGQFKDSVDNLGTNLEGTRLGLVVPAYMEDVTSIEDLVE